MSRLATQEIIRLHDPLTRRLVHNLMIGRLMPWRLEFGWTVEVVDANDATVIKCMNADEANEIIAMANVLAVQDAAWSEELDRMLDEGNL
jgi:hypothetical protein